MPTCSFATAEDGDFEAMLDLKQLTMAMIASGFDAMSGM